MEMEEEIIFNEIVRVVEEIDKLIGLKANLLSLSEKIFFNQGILINVKDLYMKGVVYSFNQIVGSYCFREATRKARIDCLISYKENLIKMIE